jgi:neutral ceramidase
MTEASYLTVEQNVQGNWTVRFDDGHWETKYSWKRVGIAESHATISWEIPAWTEPGQYRIRHFGYHKTLLEQVLPFEGTTRTFTVS